MFPGYDQEAWVRTQGYHEAPWRELVELWRAYNLHLARVMEVAPERERLRPRPRHSLQETAWEAVPEGQPATLEYVMRDYTAHLLHHVRQVLPEFVGG